MSTKSLRIFFLLKVLTFHSFSILRSRYFLFLILDDTLIKKKKRFVSPCLRYRPYIHIFRHFYFYFYSLFHHILPTVLLILVRIIYFAPSVSTMIIVDHDSLDSRISLNYALTLSSIYSCHFRCL